MVLELIEVQKIQEGSHLSYPEWMSGEEVNEISETENIEKYPDTMSMTEY